jgi:hypothetical protein
MLNCCQNCGTRCSACVRGKGKCKSKIDFSVKVPSPFPPLPPKSNVVTQSYKVGGGEGPLLNQYTVSVPAGTQFITIRTVGAGGGGGGQLATVSTFFCPALLSTIAQNIQGGDGGGSGRIVEWNRPFAVGFPSQINIEVGAASSTPTDLSTGNGIDGGDSIISFTPTCPGFEKFRAPGGKGGTSGRTEPDPSDPTAPGPQIPGNGGDGDNGGGGAGNGSYPCGIPVEVFAGSGGAGLDLVNGFEGDFTTGGDGGLNQNSGSVGASGFGGGGGGASSVLLENSGGVGGPAGDFMNSNNGGDAPSLDKGGGGGGAGLYQPDISEEGVTIFTNGGRGDHGVVDIFFYVFEVPS